MAYYGKIWYVNVRYFILICILKFKDFKRKLYEFPKSPNFDDIIYRNSQEFL